MKSTSLTSTSLTSDRAASTSRRGAALIALAAVSLLSVPATAAPKKMTRDEIVALAKTVPGFSYWWGGSKWKPGASDKGKCSAKSGSGCPNCSHSGSWGADCSGFVGKAWQVAVPKALDVTYHPYSTVHFTNNETWWTKINRSATQKGDAFTYNTNGAGHIFLYEKGDPWGNVWAWECKGCSSGCVYNLRAASSTYGVRQRKLIGSAAPVCAPHCEGAVMVDAKCGKGDCSKYGATCANDSLGLRCVSVFCPAKGSATGCTPDGKLGTCKDGALAAAKCGGGTICAKMSVNQAKCVPPCPASCNDGNICTNDACDPTKGVCTHSVNGASCDDGVPCTTGDTCKGSTCAAGGAKNCDDGNACTADTCNAADGSCQHAAKTCDDGDPCTSDTCDAGTGTCGYPAKDCSDGDPCTVDACASGPGGANGADGNGVGCQHTPKACDDGDACTTDACNGSTGICAHGEASCDDGNPCSVDGCANGACTHGPAGGVCDDGDPCTVSDRCVNVTCAGKAMACDDGVACTKDSCSDGVCDHKKVGGEPTAGCLGGRVVLLDACGEVVATLEACAEGTVCFHGQCMSEAAVAQAADAVGSVGGGSPGGVLSAAAPPPSAASGCSARTGRTDGTFGWLLLAALAAVVLRRRSNIDASS